jgi:hypothetical protein
LKVDGPFGRLKPGQGSHQLRLAVAFHPGHADDLTPRRVERYVMKSSAAQRLHRKDHVVRSVVGLRRECRSEHPANDHAQKLGIADLIDQSAAADPTVAKHGDAVCDLAKLREPVRDVDHGGSGLDDAANALEQHLGRILVERGGGFVQQQNSWIDRQGLGDFEQMLLRHCQRHGTRAQRNVEANRLQHRLGRDLCVLSGEHRCRQSHLQIFKHRKIVEDGRM